MMRWHQVNIAFFRDIKLVVVLAAIGSLIQLQIVLAKGALICHVKLKDANWGQSLAAIAINKKCLAGKNLNKKYPSLYEDLSIEFFHSKTRVIRAIRE
ncbi:hypothetical protein TUMSATVNIG1_25560 [Vibrio nigripulchritudo]|nr:hypothetical protein VNTUMSATTG_25300 [Vibrio nigripulchritudo]BDU31947.1 hypothetical protein TUMSATVNIG1_25560 [Vibrio nigripulchritudo]